MSLLSPNPYNSSKKLSIIPTSRLSTTINPANKNTIQPTKSVPRTRQSILPVSNPKQSITTLPGSIKTVSSPKNLVVNPRQSVPSSTLSVISPKQSVVTPILAQTFTRPVSTHTFVSPIRTQTVTSPISTHTVVTPILTLPKTTQTVVSPRQSVVSPRQSVVSPRQSVVSPRQSVVSPRQSVVSPRQSVVSPRQSVVSPRQSVVSPRQSVVSPRQSVVSPRQSVISYANRNNENITNNVGNIRLSDLKQNFVKLPTGISDINSLDLIISSHLQGILEMINNNDSIMIDSPTGTGKSLGIPWFIGRNGKRIVISMPTVIAAESAAARQQIINPKIKVGYAAEGKVYYDETSQIIYATSGHIRRRMLDFYRQQKDGITENDNIVTMLISSTDILMLDEVHLGTLDDTVNYELWKYGSNNGYNLPKLVLSSATPENSKFTGVKRYTIKTYSHNVGISYHNNNYLPNNKNLLEDTAMVVSNFHNSDLQGEFLVFAPGKREVMSIINNIDNLLGKGKNKSVKNYVLVPAYSGLPPEMQRNIYREYGLSRETGERMKNAPRKIVVATNIAETSLTIKNVIVVIDTLTEKRSETSSSGSTALTLHNISKTSAIQRKGRTGRTGPGICYRMCTPTFFETLESTRPDEIYRVPIYNTVMEILEVGLDPKIILKILDEITINNATKQLKKLNLILPNNFVTDVGHFVTQFPLSVRNATLLWKWLELKYTAYPCIVAISMIDSYGPSYFYYPPQTNQSNEEYKIYIEKYKNDKFMSFAGRSDIHTFLNLWLKLASDIGNPRDANYNKIASWAKVNSINNQKLRELIHKVSQLKTVLNRLSINFEEGPFNTDNVVDKLKPLVKDVYSDVIMSRTKGNQPSYYHPDARNIYTLDQRNTVNKFSVKYPNQIIPVVTTVIKGNSTIRLINVALDLEDVVLTGAKPSDEQTRNLLRALEVVDNF